MIDHSFIIDLSDGEIDIDRHPRSTSPPSAATSNHHLNHLNHHQLLAKQQPLVSTQQQSPNASLVPISVADTTVVGNNGGLQLPAASSAATLDYHQPVALNYSTLSRKWIATCWLLLANPSSHLGCSLLFFRRRRFDRRKCNWFWGGWLGSCLIIFILNRDTTPQHPKLAESGRR